MGSQRFVFAVTRSQLNRRKSARSPNDVRSRFPLRQTGKGRDCARDSDRRCVRRFCFERTNGARPAISSFTASPSWVTAGQSATLSWSVSGVTSLSVDGLGAVTGSSAQVTPAADTTYVLTASNEFGSTQRRRRLRCSGRRRPGSRQCRRSECELRRGDYLTFSARARHGATPPRV